MPENPEVLIHWEGNTIAPPDHRLLGSLGVLEVVIPLPEQPSDAAPMDDGHVVADPDGKEYVREEGYLLAVLRSNDLGGNPILRLGDVPDEDTMDIIDKSEEFEEGIFGAPLDDLNGYVAELTKQFPEED
ncbi:MAG TPA: hypothetical protein VLF71_04865 [Candidatus Saccharimonadales bacterium]|nr:hypothetical protein [Candidatus Saccharimonadales bacterium]